MASDATLVGSIQTGDATSIESTFKETMAQKVVGQINDRRGDVLDSMFDSEGNYLREAQVNEGTRPLSFEDAKSRYVHRFTTEHVPKWAGDKRSDGSHYAPHYASDKEWYDNIDFPGEGAVPTKRFKRSESRNQSWPHGQSLKEPYKIGMKEGVITEGGCQACGGRGYTATGTLALNSPDGASCPTCNGTGNSHREERKWEKNMICACDEDCGNPAHAEKGGCPNHTDDSSENINHMGRVCKDCAPFHRS